VLSSIALEGGLVRELSLLEAMATLMVGVVVPAAGAAVPDPAWGTGGVATFTVPTNTSAADTALFPDGRLVVIGDVSGASPWGAIVSADGFSLTALE
jgi:hypothetical protein